MIDVRRSERHLELSGRHLHWITWRAEAESPPVSVTTMLGRLVDEAMAYHQEEKRLRAAKLEVFEASGYPEHHPDYPSLPRDVLDV